MIREVQRLFGRIGGASPADGSGERRRAERAPVAAITIVTTDGCRLDAEMRDVSADGAMIITARGLIPGTRLDIELADLHAPVSAHVVRANGTEAGFQFDIAGSGIAIAGWAKGRYGVTPTTDNPGRT